MKKLITKRNLIIGLVFLVGVSGYIKYKENALCPISATNDANVKKNEQTPNNQEVKQVKNQNEFLFMGCNGLF